jgi:3-dehydroquinate dehydratase / shikimate dehydrogenase
MVEALDLGLGPEECVERLFGEDRVCGVVAAATAREMRVLVRRATQMTGTIELRLDYLRSQAERDTFLAWLGRQRLRKTFIATCRSRRGGGLFRGNRKAQLEILAHAARVGCGWCDVEIETAKHYLPGQIHQALSPARLMISHHDFRCTPVRLSRIVRELQSAAGDAIKVATQCNSISDSARVCELARDRRDAVAIPMGELGLAGRVLALKAGSALAYASVAAATAPGQLTLDAMENLYRAERITRKTRVYGVIGNPIGHSLSPLLHNTAYRAAKFDAVFVPFLVRDLKDFLGVIKPFSISGFAVTIPHKEGILRHLDGCDPLAERIGAVNTVVVRGGARLYGYNTDYVGVLRSLERRMTLAGSRILLVGAGGAARAAAFALVQAGALVCLHSRRPERARALARSVGAQVIARPELRREFFDAIVNCTPLGLDAQPGSPLRAQELHCRVVMDMVYRPQQTELLRIARRRGIATIPGIEMFLAQGFAQCEIWTGQRAPETAMRRAVVTALKLENKSEGHR